MLNNERIIVLRFSASNQLNKYSHFASIQRNNCSKPVEQTTVDGIEAHRDAETNARAIKA